MKTKIIILFLLSSLVFPTELFSQSYTTESKSCGSCQKPVSSDSKVGMTCPHCGVRWGYENATPSTNYNTNYNTNYSTNNNYNPYNSYKTSGTTTTNANLRQQPSKSATVLKVVPPYTTVSIINSSGDWYYVSYSYFDYNSYSSKKLNGYIHKSIIR